jgi:hypothetical protein
VGTRGQGQQRSGLLAAILTSTLVATLISSGLSFYQISSARADNSASLRREALVQLQAGLIDLTNAQKSIYLITLREFLKTGEWKTQIDLRAEENRAHSDTKVDALTVRVADPELTQQVKALEKNVFDISSTVSREDAEHLSVTLDRNFEKTQRRIGELLGDLKGLPLSERVRNWTLGKDQV